MMPPINIVITNVPGPQVPLYLGGARLVSIFGLGPLVHNQGMIIVIQSYAGVVTNIVHGVPQHDAGSAYFCGGFISIVPRIASRGDGQGYAYAYGQRYGEGGNPARD